MTCRESKLTSALTTIARGMTGIEDNQVLSLAHTLQDEVPNSAGQVNRERWNRFIDDTIRAYESGSLTISRGSRDPRRRLEQARSEELDTRRFYAAERIVERCSRAVASQENYINTYSRDTGKTVDQSTALFKEYFDAAQSDRTLKPTREFKTSFLNNPDNSGLFTDRASLYAYQKMEETRQERTREVRPAVQRQQVDSSAIREMGYDSLSGRLEIVMNSNPDRTYAYRVDQETFNRMMAADSLGSFFARNIRGNSQYRYDTAAEAEQSSVHERCVSCGQWMSPGNHYCPPPGSQEQTNQEVRRVLAERNGTTENQPPLVRIPSMRTRIHNTGNGTLRLGTRSRIQQEARRNTRVAVPIHYATSYNNTVSGQVQVDYNGWGAGYNVSPITEPGDSGTNNLRCTCVQYRARYTCPHVEEAVSSVRNILNNEQQRANMTPIVAEVSAELTEEYERSQESIAISTENWVGVNSSFEEDPQIFQELYAEAREKRTAYKNALSNGLEAEYPVPYYKENAFGGLAKKDSGRGFGIEIEYSFDDSLSWSDRLDKNRAIGRELYALGLTESSDQQGYGYSHGWYREHHEMGWAFEEDGSTVGGGEIISPVMYDETDTWDNIEKICNVLKTHGAQPTRNTGLHVHVGIGDYDHTVENHNRFIAAVNENEDLLYRLATNPEVGRHRGLTYCSPNSQPSVPYANIDRARYDNSGHDLAVNMEAVRGDRGDHIEVRMFDASLNPGVIQTQIATSVYMAEGGLRENTADLIDRPTHPLGERLEANPRRNTLSGEEWNESTKTIRRFIDRFLPGTTNSDKDNPQVKQIVSLFASTKWQKRRWS